MYIPEVRIIKFWKNGSCEQVFKSYHAESILFHALEQKLPFAGATLMFFDAAYDKLAPDVLTEDPGAPGVYVDERLEPEERATARRAVAIARRDAYAANSATTLEEALEAWARVFGPSFPAPSTSRDAVAGSVLARTAGVTGLGLTPRRGHRTVQPRSWRIRP